MTDRYLVVGLRRSGLAACAAIRRVWPDAEVVAADADAATDVTALDGLGVEVRLGPDPLPVDGLRAVVKSPGVPGGVPQIDAVIQKRTMILFSVHSSISKW